VCLLSTLRRLRRGQRDDPGTLGRHLGRVIPHFGSFRGSGSSFSDVVCARQKGGPECSSIGGSRGYHPRLYWEQIYTGLKEPSVTGYGISFHS